MTPKVDRARRNALKSIGVLASAVAATAMTSRRAAADPGNGNGNGNGNGGNGNHNGWGGGGNCFLRGTQVLTREGYRPIESLKAGHPVEMPEEETLADSLLGGIGLNNQYTFEITRDYVDETAMVAEEQIADGIVYLMENHKVIAEGASCVGIAYALQEGNIRPGSNVAIVVTGCGIPMNQIKKIIDTNY